MKQGLKVMSYFNKALKGRNLNNRGWQPTAENARTYAAPKWAEHDYQCSTTSWLKPSGY